MRTMVLSPWHLEITASIDEAPRSASAWRRCERTRRDAEEGFATGELGALFKDGWEILRDEVADTTPDWAADHAKMVRFVAKRK